MSNKKILSKDSFIIYNKMIICKSIRLMIWMMMKEKIKMKMMMMMTIIRIMMIMMTTKMMI